MAMNRSSPTPRLSGNGRPNQTGISASIKPAVIRKFFRPFGGVFRYNIHEEKCLPLVAYSLVNPITAKLSGVDSAMSTGLI